MVIPLISTDNPDGTPRRIPSWTLVVTVVLAYICGVMAGFSILLFAPKIIYFSSYFKEGSAHPVHVDRRDRYWSIEYPKVEYRPRITAMIDLEELI